MDCLPVTLLILHLELVLFFSTGLVSWVKGSFFFVLTNNRSHIRTSRDVVGP